MTSTRPQMCGDPTYVCIQSAAGRMNVMICLLYTVMKVTPAATIVARTSHAAREQRQRARENKLEDGRTDDLPAHPCLLALPARKVIEWCIDFLELCRCKARSPGYRSLHRTGDGSPGSPWQCATPTLSWPRAEPCAARTDAMARVGACIEVLPTLS